jgi:hypothetical protein
MDHAMAKSRHALTLARAACTNAIEKIDEALEQIDASHRLHPMVGRIGTKHTVLEYLSKSDGARTSTEIYEVLHAAGSAVTKDAIYQMLHRLAERGEIRRVTQGVYESIPTTSPTPSVIGTDGPSRHQ